MTSTRKANVIDQDLPHWNHGFKAKTAKMEKVRQKEMHRKAPVRLVHQINFRVSAVRAEGARDRHAILGLRPNVSSTKRMNVAKLRKRARFFIQTKKRQARSRQRTRSLKKRLMQLCAEIENWVMYLRTANCQNEGLDLRTGDGPL